MTNPNQEMTTENTTPIITPPENHSEPVKPEEDHLAYLERMRGKGYIENLQYCLDRAFKISGRSSRGEYWKFNAITLIIGSLFPFLFDRLIQIVPILSLILGFFYLVFALLLFIPSFTVSVRRLHDLDKSGWWLLINLIPVLGNIYYFYLTCCKGTEGLNKYGDQSNCLSLTSEEAAPLGKPASPTSSTILLVSIISIIISALLHYNK